MTTVRPALISYLLSGILLMTLCVMPSFATTPPSPPYDSTWSTGNDYSREDLMLRLFSDEPRRDLDNYIGAFERACAFLDSMQEHDQDSRDFGGLHEGEGQFWDIIETDNTQEAIRVWCEHVLFFDDPDTYRSNIDAAWEYCYENPAWEESAPDGMYAMHNSGWGLIAEMGYRRAFEDEEHRQYGLNCADHLVENVPEIEVDMQDLLMPLVAGWSAGTLYRYGVFEDNEDYIDAALRIGSQVQAWIDHDVDRLNSNEIWALCGGTALWGVVNSVGNADSAQTTEWLADVTESMDLLAGNGQWNNSWNIWYAHAWVDAWKLTNVESYVNNAIVIVDSLLAQDTDGDGGIQATIGDRDDRDQAWVTAYMSWMGFRNLFDRLPETAVALDSIATPSPLRSWPLGQPLEFGVWGTNLSGNNGIEATLTLTGSFETTQQYQIDGWQPTLLTFDEEWTPEELGEYAFTAVISNEDDPDLSDDSLSFRITILPLGELQISSHAPDVDESVECVFYCYNLDVDPGEVFSTFTTTVDQGDIDESLMVGWYNIVGVPSFPYIEIVMDSIEIAEEDVQELTFEFYHPSILLIDDDIDTTNSEYYRSALNNLGYTNYHWRTDNNTPLTSAVIGFPTIIYFSGDRVDGFLREDIRRALGNHLSSGNSLFITGQNISDGMYETAFLSDTLHCIHLIDAIDEQIVSGSAQDEVLDSLRVLLVGNNGANNQNSPAGIEPLAPAVTCAVYRNVEDTSAAIRWEEENGARGVFFGFGLEGIHNARSFASREDILGAILDWFDTPLQVDDDNPNMSRPNNYNMSVYPNPANGSVSIRLDRPVLGATLVIHDLSGRLVKEIPLDFTSEAIWDGSRYTGELVSSGVYIVRLKGVNGTERTAQKIVILR